jgi:hypothetical protein
LGVPHGDTSFGALTPFNPPFQGTDIVTVRGGGFIELQLGSPIAVGPGAMLGVFVNNGIIDVSPAEFDEQFNVISGGTGQAGTPAGISRQRRARDGQRARPDRRIRAAECAADHVRHADQRLHRHLD